MDGSLILALETATSHGGIALTRGGCHDGQILAEAHGRVTVTHSRRLLGGIQAMLRENDVAWQDLAGIAVGAGPGSFTGLRIGMAAAKGLALAAKTRFFVIPTLDALALGCNFSERHICCVLDARKQEVYTACYRATGAGAPDRITPLRAVAPQKLVAELDDIPLLLVGDGALAYHEVFAGHKNICLAPAWASMPRASAIGLLAGDRLAQGEEDDPLTAAPLYVRASEAEILYKKRRSMDGR